MLTSFAEASLLSDSTNAILSFNFRIIKLSTGLNLLIMEAVLFLSSFDPLLLRVTIFATVLLSFVYTFFALSSDANLEHSTCDRLRFLDSFWDFLR